MARQAGAKARRARWLLKASAQAVWPALASLCWLGAAAPDDLVTPQGVVEESAREAVEAAGQLKLPWELPPAATDAPAPQLPGDPEAPPSPCPPGPMRTRFLGLPVYGTLPNEGSTFGIIPIVLRVCRTDGKTHNIFAPSLSWNRALGVTGTLRWFGFLPGNQSLTATASFSQHTNRGALLLWEVRPKAAWAWNFEAALEVQQSIFFRFFGIGPTTEPSDETNQARRRGRATVRRGLNLPHHLGAGLTLGGTWDQTLDGHIASLTPTRTRFGDTPGVFGHAAALAVLADLQYDSRAEGDNATHGLLASLQGGPLFGITGVPTHLRVRAEVRALWQYRPWCGGAARARVAYVNHPHVPFYYLSSLGGGMLLRGFIQDRFVDRGAWLVELEQRFRLFTTHLLGVSVDWRVDPFVVAGQVFDHASHAVLRPRWAVGVGLRAWLRPDVVGRIDIAYGGEGIAPYVELGYPF